MPVYAKGYVQRCKKWDASYLILVLRSVPPTFSHVQNHSCSDIKEPPGRHSHYERSLGSNYALHQDLMKLAPQLRSSFWAPFCFPGAHDSGHASFCNPFGFRDTTDVVFRRGWFSETAPYTLMISMRDLISYKVSACCKRCDVFLCTNLNVHLLFIRIIAQHSFFEFLLALHHRSLSWYSGDKHHRISFKLCWRDKNKQLRWP